MTAFQSDLREKLPVRASGVRGANSRPFERTFRNMAALNKFIEAEAGNVEVTHITQDPSVHIEEVNQMPSRADRERNRPSRRKVQPIAPVPVVEEAEHSAHYLAYVVSRDVSGTPAPAPEGATPPASNVISLVDIVRDPAKAREVVAARDAAAPPAKAPRAPSRLKQMFDEWNSLVPQAQGLGLKVRTLASLHENVAAGEKRVAWLREQIAAAAPRAEEG